MEGSAEMTQAEFDEFDRASPIVWDLFVRFTFEAIHAGATRFSVDSVTERIRWFTTVETRSGEFGLNNNFRPFYARKWQKELPEYAELFETRKAACDLVEVVT
jgi:hypothetical protein